MNEVRQFDELFCCGVRRRYSGRAKNANRDVFVFCRRITDDKKSYENFDCGVRMSNSGRVKVAHKDCLYPAGR